MLQPRKKGRNLARFSSPLQFSRAYKAGPKKLRELGAFDCVLAVDTKLFIDPIALLSSEVVEVRQHSFERVQKFFREIYKLLKQSQTSNDLWIKAAMEHWLRKELAGTCLRYGGASIFMDSENLSTDQ